MYSVNEIMQTKMNEAASVLYLIHNDAAEWKRLASIVADRLLQDIQQHVGAAVIQRGADDAGWP